MLAAWIGWQGAILELRPIAAALLLRSSGHVSNLVRKCERELARDKLLQQLACAAIDDLRVRGLERLDEDPSNIDLLGLVLKPVGRSPLLGGDLDLGCPSAAFGMHASARIADRRAPRSSLDDRGHLESRSTRDDQTENRGPDPSFP